MRPIYLEAECATHREYRAVSVELAEVEYDEERGTPVLSLRFLDGMGFQLRGTNHVRQFLDDCVGRRCDELVHGIANLAGNKFWAYYDAHDIVGIGLRGVPKKYELRDVTKEFVPAQVKQ